MTAEIAQPLIEPDATQMRQHVEHLFGGYLDGCHEGKIELAWCDGNDGKLRHAPPLGADPDNVGMLEPWTPPDVKAPISRHTCNQILEDIGLRWKVGNPYSANYQARGRYVVARMVKEYGVPKASAEELLASWFANGVVADEVFDAHRKATGLRVLRFIHD